MRVEIKQLEIIDNRPHWNPIPANDLLGKSVVDYMLSTDKKVIAALYQNDKAVAFVSNDPVLVDKYADRGVSISAREVKDLLGTTVVPPIVAYTFNGSTVGEIKRPEEKNND